MNGVLFSCQTKRTFLPNASNCPLCPSQKDGMKTDIPVSDYEIAVFDNRFSALVLIHQNKI